MLKDIENDDKDHQKYLPKSKKPQNLDFLSAESGLFSAETPLFLSRIHGGGGGACIVSLS